MQFIFFKSLSTMLVNPTKTTLSVFRVAIAYSDEVGFAVITKIIQLFRWLRINIIFEPIDIAGQNYQKKMPYGIDEDNLTHLKKTNIFLHTPFNYSFFNNDTQVDVERYLNVALQNFFVYAFFKDKNNIVKKQTFTANFFKQNKQYIENISEYGIFINNAMEETENYNIKESDFYTTFGDKYAVFALNNFDDNVIIEFTKQLLLFLRLEKQANFLNSFKTIDDAIKDLKKNAYNVVSFIEIKEIKLLPSIIWKEMTTNLPSTLTDINFILEGKYIVKEIVSAIKEDKIKLPENYELHQIIKDDIEYYPNINFWEEIVINPMVKLRTKEIN